MKHEPATRTHEPDEVPAATIHDYEADETLLARWLRKAMSRGPSFWAMALGAGAVLVGLIYFLNGLTTGSSSNARAWGEVMVATSPEDFQRVAETAAGTPAGRWAALKAASTRYRDGLSRLPADREAANPILAQALDGFQAVADDAKDDPTLRRLALLGVARTHETRDELDDALSSYEKVASAWPDTEDGKEAAARVAALKAPEAIAFYKKFAAFKPGKTPSVTLPPRGSNRIDLPSGHPALDGPMIPAPALPGGVSPGSVPSPAPKAGELPSNVFQGDSGKAAPAKNDAIPDVFPDEPKGEPAKPK